MLILLSSSIILLKKEPFSIWKKVIL